LQLSYLPLDVIYKCLPSILETTSIFVGVDVQKQPILVLPTIHYNIGGILTKYTSKVLTINTKGKDKVVLGLFACSKATYISIYNANYLRANSLLNLIVFSYAVLHTIRDNFKLGELLKETSANAGVDSTVVLDKLRTSKGLKSTHEIRLAMQKAMQTDVSYLTRVLGGSRRSINHSSVLVLRTKV
jgi:succinate dehydrogenase (ubiquinone) flavoprotein subunit